MPTIDDVIVPAPQPDEVLTPMDLFGNAQPFELEIGCGKGGYLLKRAGAESSVSLLGIEWANKYFKFAADRMARWGLSNVRLMRTDAGHFVINHLAPGSLMAIHVYHPDPWPKKRHHKRRLFQSAFIQAGNRALIPGGRWFIQTDHRAYFEWILDLMNQAAELMRQEGELAAEQPEEAMAGTNFEIKYRREGRLIYRAVYVRKGFLGNSN